MAASASYFVRRCAIRCCPRHLHCSSFPASSSVSRQHLSFGPEIQPTTKHERSRIPWLMLSSPTKPQSRFLYKLMLDDHRFKLHKELDLPEIAGNRCIGVSQGYILTVPTRCSPDIIAINPVTKAHLPLPSTAGLPDPQISDLTMGDDKTLWEQEQATVDSNHYSLSNGRAFLSPSLDTIVLFRRFSGTRSRHQASYARLSSSSSSSWIPLSFPMCHMDCVFHKGKFLAVEDSGVIVSIKEFGFQPLFMPRDIKFEERTNSIHLVETPDGKDLFLVQRSRLPRMESPPFEVFRLDKNDRCKWKRVNSLGGLTFFVGANQSVSMLASDFPGLASDSIYFIDDNTFDGPSAFGKSGVFHLQDETFQSFQFTDEEVQLNWPPPMWYVPVAC